MRQITKTKTSVILVALLATAFLLSSCGTIPIRTPLPEELAESAQVPGIPRAKFWGDKTPSFFEKVVGQPREKLMREFPGIYGVEHNYLALSGGGANGAFGAGLMVGWTASGTRPEFTMVTGISTGVLMATFAFLGKEYDAPLKEMYTNYSTKDLVRKRNILAALTGVSAADTAPLKKMLVKSIDRQVMEKVAEKYKTPGVHVIRNSFLKPDWETVKPKIP